MRCVSLYVGLLAFAFPLRADMLATVDLLDPSDGGLQAPPGLLVLDILAEVDPGDAWTASGLSASALGLNTFIYSDNDPNNPLRNPGADDPFVTCISAPLPRHGTARYENGRALILGSDCPLTNRPIVESDRVVVSWGDEALLPCFSNPTANGALARIVVALDPALTCDGDVNCCFSVYPPNDVPPEATQILVANCSRPGSISPFGICWGTCDHPGIVSLPWVVAQTPIAGSCRYDLDRNRTIDVEDLALILAAFGALDGQPEFNPRADVDGNGRIELPDLTAFLSHWGAF